MRRGPSCCLLRAVWCLAFSGGWCASAEPFHLPTANHAIFERGQEERFLVGTVGKPWTSGGFGCVRTEGWQMHEGLDIKCLQRDAHGEPADPVSAAADGTVAYINARSSLSNYGNYVDPQSIEIYDRMVWETDFTRQRALMREFEKRVLDTEAHEIFLLWRYRIVAHRSYVKGWKVSPSHYVNQDLATIWLDR